MMQFQRSALSVVLLKPALAVFSLLAAGVIVEIDVSEKPP
jgi:hypothetical protein